MAIITISGDLGSGKSTTAKGLIEELSKYGLTYERYSIGAAMRELANNMGIDIIELNRLAADEKSDIDRKMDTKLRRYGILHKNAVVDARLGFHFIPDSFKIKLTVDPEVGGKRAFGDLTRKENAEGFKTLDEAVKKVRERRSKEVERFKGKYKVDIEKDKNYDMIIDTTNKTIKETVNLILCEMIRRGLLVEIENDFIKNQKETKAIETMLMRSALDTKTRII